jgi:DNA excision repair protein ERCC-2
MVLSIFPYQPRPGQERLMDLVSSACRDRAHLVLESGTGTGKTVCALSSCIDFCKSRGKKVLHVTRTNSQQTQVMLELRQIAERTGVFGMALQGRKNMCPLARSDSELVQGNPEELSKVCSERKARVIKGDDEACKYYASTVSEDLQPVMRYAREELPTAEEFSAYCTYRPLTWSHRRT